MRDPEITASKVFDPHLSNDISPRLGKMAASGDAKFGKTLEASQKKIENKDDIYALAESASVFGPWAAILGMFDRQFITPDNTKDLLDSMMNDSDNSKISGSEEKQPEDRSGQNTGSSRNGRELPADQKEIKAAVQQFLSRIASSDRVPGAAAIPYSQFVAGMEKLGSRFDLKAIIDKIVEASKLVKSKEKTELQISLKPDWLGDVLLSISRTKDGLAVNITAGNNAKLLIDSQISDLEQALKAANINISSLQVSVGGQNGSGHQEGAEDGAVAAVTGTADAAENASLPYPVISDDVMKFMMDLNRTNVFSRI